MGGYWDYEGRVETQKMNNVDLNSQQIRELKKNRGNKSNIKKIFQNKR